MVRHKKRLLSRVSGRGFFVAGELARVHGVELVDGKLFRLRLQEVLGESWG